MLCKHECKGVIPIRSTHTFWHTHMQTHTQAHTYSLSYILHKNTWKPWWKCIQHPNQCPLPHILLVSGSFLGEPLSKDMCEDSIMSGGGERVSSDTEFHLILAAGDGQDCCKLTLLIPSWRINKTSIKEVHLQRGCWWHWRRLKRLSIYPPLNEINTENKPWISFFSADQLNNLGIILHFPTGTCSECSGLNKFLCHTSHLAIL